MCLLYCWLFQCFGNEESIRGERMFFPKELYNLERVPGQEDKVAFSTGRSATGRNKVARLRPAEVLPTYWAKKHNEQLR